MIYGKLQNALRYRGISPDLDLALEHLTPEFLASVGQEHVQLKGTDVYCFKVDLTTVPEEKAFFENHHVYADIHVVMDGVEVMDIALPETLEMYEERPESDAYFFHGEGYTRLVLEPGSFLVCFPEDAHKTMITLGEPAPLTKVVFKIRL